MISKDILSHKHDMTYFNFDTSCTDELHESLATGIHIF